MIQGRQFAANVVKGVGNYFGGIAREVRDIPTAFGTNASIAKNTTVTGPKDPLSVAGEKNVIKQVKEVGGALLGQKGNRSDQYTPEKGYVKGTSGLPKPKRIP
jgi:hypothetical protein